VVDELKLGWARSRGETSYSFKKPDGAKCTTTKEAAHLVAGGFTKNLNIDRLFDFSVLDAIPVNLFLFRRWVEVPELLFGVVEGIVSLALFGLRGV